jgi:hypothetical protein
VGAQGGEGVIKGGPGRLGTGAREDFDSGGESGAGLSFGFQGGESGAFGSVSESEEAFFGGGEVAFESEQLVVGKGIRDGVPEVKWRGAAVLGRGGKDGSHGGTEVIL